MSKLVISEPPLQVLPSLAVAIGLNEAIIVQQIHYWVVGKSGKVIDGQRWIYNGYREWKEQFPFWSEDTIQRAFRSAEKQGVIVAQRQKGFDRRKLYRVDYEALDNLILQSSNTASCGDGQPQNADIRTPQDAVMLTESISETTTETTTEIPAQKTRGNPALYSLALAMAEVCHVNFEASKGRMMKEAKLLSAALPVPTPELIKANYNGDPRAFWKSHDWRGKKGQFPTPSAIRETWGQWNVSIESGGNQRMTVAQQELQRIQNGESENDILGIFSNL